MKKILGTTCLVPFLSLSTFSDDFSEKKLETSFNAYFGQKYLDEDDWAPTDELLTVGVGMDIGFSNSPFRFHVSYLSSESDTEVIPAGYDTLTVKTETSELRIGGKYIVDSEGSISPYLGAGAVLVSAETMATGADFEGDSVGGWVSAGLNWNINQTFHLGFEGSYSFAEVDINETTTDIEVASAEAGGLQLALVLGLTF